MNLKLKEERLRILIILILMIVSFLLIYYFEVILGTSILVSHFFYFPSILACLWWKSKGLIIPVLLAALIIMFHLIPEEEFFNLETINNFLRAISLIIVGIVVSNLSGHIPEREIEFNAILEDLRRSNEDLQQFAYVASHDLQEPLRAIVSFSQLLEDEYHDKIAKEGKEFIHFITDGAKKMNTLIKDLLSYSRITTHAQPSKLTNLEKILEDALFNLQEAIKGSGAVITHDKMPILNVDKTQFIQLFQNLLSNAIKFRRQETPRIHIGVKNTSTFWGVKTVNGKLILPFSYGIFGLSLTFAYVIIIPLSFIFLGFSSLIWQLILILVLIIMVIYSAIQLIIMKKFEREKILKYIIISELSKAFIPPLMLISLIGLSAFLLMAFIFIWSCIFMLYEYGTSPPAI